MVAHSQPYRDRDMNTHTQGTMDTYTCCMNILMNTQTLRNKETQPNTKTSVCRIDRLNNHCTQREWGRKEGEREKEEGEGWKER